MSIVKPKINNDADVLYDTYKKCGKRVPWSEKKIKSIKISESYNRLSERNWSIDCYTKELRKCSVSIRDCGTYLEFKRYLNDGSLKLHSGNFCKKRLCPMCQWRRSLKMFWQTSKVMERAKKKDSCMQYIFLTLTVKNVTGENLSSAIDIMQVSYKRMIEYKNFRQSVLGGIRVLEVTRNKNVFSPFFGTFHPHFHCILMVSKNYYGSELYRTKNDWANMWNRSLRNQGWRQEVVPICDVRKISQEDMNIEKAVCEVSKYSVKDSDIINDDLDFMDDTVYILHYALKSRRLITYSGEFKRIRKELMLDDIDDGDLIHVGDMEDKISAPYEVLAYVWHYGAFEFLLKGKVIDD